MCLRKRSLAVFLGLLKAGAVHSFRRSMRTKLLVLGTVLLYPRKAQRIIAERTRSL